MLGNCGDMRNENSRKPHYYGVLRRFEEKRVIMCT